MVADTNNQTGVHKKLSVPFFFFLVLHIVCSKFAHNADF